MRTREIDFLEIEDKHQAIHRKLENWGLWLKPNHSGQVHPMFQQAQSNSRQWHAPEIRDTCNILEAQEIEKAVFHLPVAQREAVRWFYVRKGCPLRKAKQLGVSQLGLKELTRDARQMLCNRGM